MVVIVRLGAFATNHRRREAAACACTGLGLPVDLQCVCAGAYRLGFLRGTIVAEHRRFCFYGIKAGFCDAVYGDGFGSYPDFNSVAAVRFRAIQRSVAVAISEQQERGFEPPG